MAETEKLKTSFEVERSAWAEEKTSLTQQAEKAEVTLQEATTEFTGLKRHVSQMVSAIFGKSPCYLFKLNICRHNVSRHLTNF